MVDKGDNSRLLWLWGACAVVLVASCPLAPTLALADAGNPGLGPFSAAAFVSVGAVSVALLLGGSFEYLQSPNLLRVAASCYALASIGCCVLGIGPSLFALALGAVSGVAAVPVLLAAFARLACASFNRSLVRAAACLGCAGFVAWGVGCAPSMWGRRLIMAALALVATGIVFRLTAHQAHGLGAGSSAPMGSMPSVDETGILPSLLANEPGRLVPLLATPLIGLFSYALFIKSGVGSGVVRPMLFGFDQEMLTLCLCCLGALAVGLGAADKPTLPVISQVAVPVAIVAMLVAQSVPIASFSIRVASVLSVAVTASALVLACAVGLTLVGAGECGPGFGFGAVAGTYCLGRLAGLGLDVALDDVDSPEVYYRVVNTLLLCAMLLCTIYLLRREAGAGVGGEAALSSPSGRQKAQVSRARACEVVSLKYALTPRESEVLAGLARGLTSVAIAGELVISDNTVRTHMKSIYRKLGIASRAELFALVDESTGDSAADRARR